jgi:hypothetical protein
MKTASGPEQKSASRSGDEYVHPEPEEDKQDAVTRKAHELDDEADQSNPVTVFGDVSSARLQARASCLNEECDDVTRDTERGQGRSDREGVSEVR